MGTCSQIVFKTPLPETLTVPFDYFSVTVMAVDALGTPVSVWVGTRARARFLVRARARARARARTGSGPGLCSGQGLGLRAGPEPGLGPGLCSGFGDV